jgi:hypothetical protein
MSSTDKFLSLVKTTESNVSEFVGATLDPCYTKGLIESYPYILKIGNSFYFDYSGSANANDLKFLKKFFNGIPTGATLSMQGGTYYFEQTGQQYSFSGTYTFRGKTGSYNQYLNFYGNTYPVGLPDGVYESKNFLSKVSFSAITGGTCSYYINKLNKEDPFNLSFFGIYGNDYGYDEYLEVLGSSSNTGRLKINSFLKLNDSTEIIYLNNDNVISNENLYFVPVTVNYYLRGIPDLITLSANKNVNGLLKKINYDGDTVDIFENQNLRQKYSRALQDTQNYYDWFASHPSANYKNVYNPLAYDSLSFSINYYSLLQVVAIVLYEGDAILSNNYTETLNLVVDGVQTNSVSYSNTGRSAINVNPNLKIDLSDASLYSAIIEPFTDYNCSIPLSDYYYLNGVPGFDGASFIYFKSDQSPSYIYLKVTIAGVSLVLSIAIQS